MTDAVRFGDIASKNFLTLRAISHGKRYPNASPENTSGPFLKDGEGREFVTVDSLKKMNRKEDLERAFNLHGNDPQRRLSLGNFPVKGRRLMMNYDYQGVIERLGFKNRWDWLYIYGGKGTGKTTLACRQAWEWMKADPVRKADYLSLADWIESLKSSFSDDEVVLPKLGRFVVIDDFDKFYNTDWQFLQIFRLIDHLYRKDVRVVFTSNLSLNDVIKKARGNGNIETTVDRIKERSKGAKLIMNWGSYR